MGKNGATDNVTSQGERMNRGLEPIVMEPREIVKKGLSIFTAYEHLPLSSAEASFVHP